MLYMGFRRSLGVGDSFTLSCLSLTNIFIFFVYTHLSRVGVWIGYPYTLDIGTVKLNSNRLNKNQSKHTSIFSPSSRPLRVRYLDPWCYNEPYGPKRLATAISAHKGLRSSYLDSTCGSARTFSGLHIPEQVQPQHGATVAPCTRPHRQSALTGHPSTPGREVKELNPEHHVMHSTVLRSFNELRKTMDRRRSFFGRSAEQFPRIVKFCVGFCCWSQR